MQVQSPAVAFSGRLGVRIRQPEPDPITFTQPADLVGRRFKLSSDQEPFTVGLAGFHGDKLVLTDDRNVRHSAAYKINWGGGVLRSFVGLGGQRYYLPDALMPNMFRAGGGRRD